MENVYAAPDANLSLSSESAEELFYVVSKKKFIILFAATAGAYMLYWFYKNWRCYKESKNESMWPIARAIFSIFFTHSLFSRVDRQLRKVRPEYSWNHSAQATGLVILLCIERVLDRLSMNDVGGVAVDYLTLGLTGLIGVMLFNAQKAINISCGDEEGESNSQLTGLNIMWIVFGVILWLLILAGILLPIIMPELAEA